MEPEVPYIPYAERSAKELCRDILLKAEKLYIKNDKRNLLLIIAVILVLAALVWYFNRFVEAYEKVGAYAWVGTFLITYVVFFFINRKLINEMYLTANPKQFLPLVQRLRTCIKIRHFLYLAIGLWPSLQLMDLVDAWWWQAAAIIPALLLAWILMSIRPMSDSDLEMCEDIEELESRLDE